MTDIATGDILVVAGDPAPPPNPVAQFIGGYGKIYNLGHRDIQGLLDDGPVIVQEKYDGSQFSFQWDDQQRLICRSKSKVQFRPGMELDEVDGLFRTAVEHLLEQKPHDPEYVFRAECISKPKHNSLTYDRAPSGYLVLFDVEVLNEFAETAEYVDYDGIRGAAEALGIDHALQIDVIQGNLINMEILNQWLEPESTLGGPKREGVVIKNYRVNSLRSGRPLMGKHVSEKFKEVHKRERKGSHPGQGDIIAGILMSLNTEARWLKAVQHLSDNGLLVDEPKDIGPLMKEVKRDVLDEEEPYIIEKLLEWALPRITRGVGNGLPEWYKDRLAEAQFDQAENPNQSNDPLDSRATDMVSEGGPVDPNEYVDIGGEE